MLSKRLWEVLGIAAQVKLEINTLGTLAQRTAYRDALIDYLKQHETDLDSDSQRRLSTNPLRILDSKNPKTREIIERAPKLMDFIDGEAKAHFDAVCGLLSAANITFTVNPYLVRGLDYYCLTVFEWVTDSLGAQGTVCAGGRYDGLVEQLGGKATSAVGFAMGIERVALLLANENNMQNAPDCTVVAVGDDAVQAHALQFAEKLRDHSSTLRVVQNIGGSFKSQMKRADKSGARYALIIGESEATQSVVTVKDLRENSEQRTMTFDEFILFMER